MRNLFAFVLAVLAIAVPAQAGNNRHVGYYNHPTGHTFTYVPPMAGADYWRVLDSNANSMLLPLNRWYRSTQRDVNTYEWQRHQYGVNFFDLGIGYGSYHRHRDPREEIARCVEKILKAARKNKQPTSVEQAGAICTGQSIPNVEIPPPPAPTAAPTPAPTPRIVKVVNSTGECIWAFGHPINPNAAYGIANYNGKLEVRMPQGSSCRPKGRTITPDLLEIICR